MLSAKQRVTRTEVQMHVGVVIPAYNVAPWLADAIRSVLTQTYQDWSLIVVDDGSTDATPEIAAAFADDPRIQLIRQPNQGVSAARNTGLSAVSAEAILFLDADDWLTPDALAMLSETLADCPRAVAAAAGYARVSPGGAARHAAPPPSGTLLPRLLVRNLFANGGHLLIRRRAIDAAGGFNTELSFGEDWEYWTRLALQGEFVSIHTRKPLLFVRERSDSACYRMAADPARFACSMEAVYRNPAIAARIGSWRLARLQRRAKAENAWVTGRELIRRGQPREGRAWLRRSVRAAPGLKRLALLFLSRLGIGPFRPYQSRDRPVAPRYHSVTRTI
jgi:glycosyltransferase involved in cell wall biosynthesis